MAFLLHIRHQIAKIPLFVAVSYYKNALRVYGLQKDDETFETLNLGSFHVGIAYAVNRMSAYRRYDGLLGLGRQR